MVGHARVPQVVPHATKYAKHHVRYTLASKMRTESCLDLACEHDETKTTTDRTTIVQNMGSVGGLFEVCGNLIYMSFRHVIILHGETSYKTD